LVFIALASESKGTVGVASSGLGSTDVVETATVGKAAEAVQRMHPDCTVMLT
jgi:hypothetical protein